MKTILAKTILVLLVSLFSFHVYASIAVNSGGKKFERLKERADRKFNAFSYQQAIEDYKKALEVKLDKEVKLQLANCYRLLNEPETSVKWYELALEDGGLSPEDMLHYGQVLSAAGRYDESVKVLERYQNRENWVNKKISGLKEVEKFYRNKEAFTISESIFNSEQKDFSPTYVNDGVVFVTGRPSPGLFKPEYNWDGGYFLDLFIMKEGKEPEKIQRGINTRYHEGPAVFFDNDQKMLFTRNNYYNKKSSKSEDGINKLKLFYAERKNETKWKKPQEVPFNSDQYSVGHPSISFNGIVYFASDMPGGFGGVDIYQVSLKNGIWGEPQNLGSRINTERNEMFPFIHNDSTLYFSSDGHEGLGGLDIFRVNLNDDFQPRNLGYPLNTNADDFGLTLKEGTSKGYFSSNREGGTGDDDIYEVIIFDYIITIILVDAETGEEISGKMEAYEQVIHDKEMIAKGTDRSRLAFPALRGTTLFIEGISTDYLPDSLRIETRELSREIINVTYELPLRKERAGEAEILVVKNNGEETQVAWKAESLYAEFEGTKEEMTSFLDSARYTIVNELSLENIFYDFDKSNIRSDAQVELDKLAAFMQDNETTKVMLSAHTDIRGSIGYNQLLSERRATSAKKYLEERGITSDRIFTSSFGEKKTKESCNPCTEDQHQRNRRTEIKILFEEIDDQ